MKNINKLFILIILLALTIPQPIKANEITIDANDEVTSSIDLIYFYVNLCEYCSEAKEQIDTFIVQIEDAKLDVNVNFIEYNISYYEGPVYDLYLTYLDSYGLEQSSVDTPILFVGDTYYEKEIGIEDGLNHLFTQIQSGSLPDTPVLDSKKNKEQSFTELFQDFSGLKILGIGIINGLNPCSLSMILLLVSLIMVNNSSIIKLGFTFLFGKFISFILLGTLLYQTLNYLNNTSYLFYTKLSVGLFVIILASLNIYDFIVSKKENYGKIKNQLPSGLRKINHTILAKFSSSTHKYWLFVSLFLLGVIIAISEFLCTGQVYMITINYMIKSTNGLSLLALIYLIIYSFGFVVPPAIAIIIIGKSSDLFNVAEFIREKMPLIKLITAITMIILGILTIIF